MGTLQLCVKLQFGDEKMLLSCDIADISDMGSVKSLHYLLTSEFPANAYQKAKNVVWIQ